MPAMSVLFSCPMTLRGSPVLPEYLLPWESEARLSSAYAKKYPRQISEYVLRCGYALTLLKRRFQHEAIITGRYGELFAALQALLPFGRKPHLLLDVEWPYRRPQWWRRRVSTLLHRWIAQGAWKIQVFCKIEAENYAAHYGIDRSKFVWIPYCTDLDAAASPVAEKDYIFTGGLQNRDYATLAAAVKDLAVSVRIAAPAERLDRSALAPNMEILGRLSPRDYFTALAGA